MEEVDNKEIIKLKVLNWTTTQLDGFVFRAHQLDYIVDVIHSVLSGTSVNLIEAPTGSGKSIIVLITAGVLADIYGKKSFILCSDLYLWDQYAHAIDKFKLKRFGKLKGVFGNYTCDLTDADLSLAPCRLAAVPYSNLSKKEWCIQNNWECALRCKYIKERIKAIKADVTLMTYQLWFPYMCDNNIVDSNGDPIFAKRDVVFCDECHNVPSLCQDYRAIPIELHKDMERLSELLTFCKEIELEVENEPGCHKNIANMDIEKYLDELKDIENAIYDTPKEQTGKLFELLQEYYSSLLSYPLACYSALKEIYKGAAKNDVNHDKYLTREEYKALNIASWVDKQCCSIKMYLKLFLDEDSEKYIVKVDNMVYDEVLRKKVWPDNKTVYYKFAKEDLLVYNTLLTISPYNVMLSATIGDHESFDDNIGTKYMEQKHSTMFIIPSTFDFSKSPIYYIPGHKMSKDYITQSFPINASIINTILKSPKHANEKGIIHTGSYKNAYDLRGMLDKDVQNRVFIYENSKEKKEILEKYAESSNGVLIGPTLTEGVDLPDDGCRFIIILKIPYPYLGDELVRAKCALFPRWYNSETTNSVIQSIGRGNRNPTDWCTTYILDGSFSKLYQETRNQFSPEMKERMQLITNNGRA